jgi:hypothetical protein
MIGMRIILMTMKVTGLLLNQMMNGMIGIKEN